MPFMSWALGMIFMKAYPCTGAADEICFPKEFGLGLLLTGSMPGGSTSNIFCYWGKGDVALSIIMTIFSTFTALGMLPLILVIFGGSFTDENLKINFGAIIQSLLIVIIPASIGLLTRNWDEFREWRKGGTEETKASEVEMKQNEHHKGGEETTANIELVPEAIKAIDIDIEEPVVPYASLSCTKKCAKVLEIVASVLGALFIIAALVVGIRNNPRMFQSSWPVWFVSILLQWFGTIFGIMTATCFLKYYEKKQAYSELRKIEITKAVSMETGMQNSTLAIAMITLSFPIGTCAEKNRMWNLQVIPLLYSVFLIVNSIVIVSVYRFGWNAKK